MPIAIPIHKSRLTHAWLALCFSLPSGALPLTLVQDGKSDYAILLSPAASPSENRGALELQKFLQEISGARLPIITDARNAGENLVLVGRSDALEQLKLDIPFDRLGPEGFALKTAGRRLIIAGGRERGTMYGVYTFLEKLGCRWFTPEVSRMPRMSTIRVDSLDEVQKPAFEYREPFFSEAFDKDWASRNKVNGASAHLDASTGGKLQYFPFVHSFQQLIPPDRYFKDHPEYFSLVDGKRRSERSQLCLTNPDVLRLGVQAVLRWIEQHPEAKIYSVSQNDWTGWCECDNCRRVEQEEGGAHSGPLLRYVNALAAEIEKAHPDKLIDTLAYWYTEEPPAKVRPRPNVRIRLCPIGACEAHPYEQCKYNAYFMKNLRAWSQITNQLYIWHYNTNFAHYLLPFPDFDELAADIPMYQRYGVVGLFLEGAVTKGGGAENAELRSYVMARLLWDTKADVASAVTEFHQAYYGNAAGPMREYFELLHRQVRGGPGGRGQHLWIFENPRAPYLTPEFLERARKIFRRAEQAAENGTVRSRVRKAELAIEYAGLMRAKKFESHHGWFQPPDLAALKNRWGAFLSEARAFGITNLREHSLLAADQQQFDAMMRPYRLAALRNSRLRIEVAPELGGRVIQMIDRKSGRELLFQPDPGAGQYPNLGGLAIFAYPDYVTRAPIETAWKLDPSSNSRVIVLAGEASGGLRLRRTLQLDGAEPMLRTDTVLVNGGASPREAVLQARVEVDPGALDDVVVVWRKKDGNAVERNLIQPEQQPAGTETYDAADGPQGECRVVSRRGGLISVVRFPKEQVTRSNLNWSAKGENRVSLGVWSEKRVLAPGESLKLELNYGVQMDQ